MRAVSLWLFDATISGVRLARRDRDAASGQHVNYDIHYRSGPSDRGGRRYLFVVSHMRSFSSVLCHILGSHPEIDGYAETHQSYYGRSDLHRLTALVSDMIGAPLSGRYVLDKVLARRHHLAPEILGRSDVRILFLLRGAEATLRSMLTLAREQGHAGPFNHPAAVVEQYTARLAQIEGYAARFGGGALFVESHRLMEEADAVLGSVARWLDLRAPLSTRYRTFRLTGLPGFGDPSPAIMAGRLLNDASERHPTCAPIELPADLLVAAEDAHARCRDALLRWSLHA
jgi:hypothetical protein